MNTLFFYFAKANIEGEEKKKYTDVFKSRGNSLGQSASKH